MDDAFGPLLRYGDYFCLIHKQSTQKVRKNCLLYRQGNRSNFRFNRFCHFKIGICKIGKEKTPSRDGFLLFGTQLHIAR